VHVLTKIFIVLVALLAVLLVPLVVAYAHDENSYKAQLDQALARAAASDAALKETQLLNTASEERNQSQLAQLRSEKSNVDEELTEAKIRVAEAQARLVEAEDLKTGIASRLTMLATAVEAGQTLTNGLVDELRTLRSELVAKAQHNVELDATLRDLSSQLEVAVAARKALQEQLSQMQDEHGKAMAALSRARSAGVDVNDTRLGVSAGIRPDVNLTATVIGVERGGNKVLVQIDAGSRDGVQKDWIMTVGNGGVFLGNLKIIKVDVDQSTGELTLEDPKNKVDIGNRAYTFSNQ